MPFARTVNLSEPDINAMVRDLLRHEQGVREVIVREPTRSQAQNRLYWVSLIEPLAEALSASQGEHWTKDDAHEYLKRSFLPLREVADPKSGELMYLPQSTTKLRKSDFSILLEKGYALLDWLHNQRTNRRQLVAGKR